MKTLFIVSNTFSLYRYSFFFVTYIKNERAKSYTRNALSIEIVVFYQLLMKRGRDFIQTTKRCEIIEAGKWG